MYFYLSKIIKDLLLLLLLLLLLTIKLTQLISSKLHFVFEYYRDLRHDNIVAFRGMNILKCDIEHEKFTLKAGSPFLVMEYIPKNLYRFVEDHKTPESQGLPKSQVWTIGRGIANGLMYLHTLYPPISHRDLKPDNILVRFCSHIIYGWFYSKFTLL